MSACKCPRTRCSRTNCRTRACFCDHIDAVPGPSSANLGGRVRRQLVGLIGYVQLLENLLIEFVLAQQGVGDVLQKRPAFGALNNAMIVRGGNDSSPEKYRPY